MTRDAVYGYFLIFEQNVVANFQYTDGSIELGTHEVGKRELIVSGTHKEGTAVSKSRNGLTRHIVVGEKAAAVDIAFKRNVEQTGVELIGVLLDS